MDMFYIYIGVAVLAALCCCVLFIIALLAMRKARRQQTTDDTLDSHAEIEYEFDSAFGSDRFVGSNAFHDLTHVSDDSLSQ